MKQATETTPRTGGRPPKFSGPSRPVTVTLPIRTLDQLRSIDDDRAKAIVKAVDAIAGSDTDASRQTEVIEVAPGTGLVLVPPNRSLRAIPWLKMIEIAPARYLLAIVPGTPIEKLEVALVDLIEDAKRSTPQDISMLEMLKGRIRSLRRGKKFSTAEILFVSI